ILPKNWFMVFLLPFPRPEPASARREKRSSSVVSPCCSGRSSLPACARDARGDIKTHHLFFSCGSKVRWTRPRGDSHEKEERPPNPDHAAAGARPLPDPETHQQVLLHQPARAGHTAHCGIAPSLSS